VKTRDVKELQKKILGVAAPAVGNVAPPLLRTEKCSRAPHHLTISAVANPYSKKICEKSLVKEVMGLLFMVLCTKKHLVKAKSSGSGVATGYDSWAMPYPVSESCVSPSYHNQGFFYRSQSGNRTQKNRCGKPQIPCGIPRSPVLLCRY
jgi:hypothetical protein